MGFILKLGGSLLRELSNLAINSSITSASSIEEVERLVACSSVTIFTSFLGSKSGTITLLTAPANFSGDLIQSGIGMPKVSARNTDAAITKFRWPGSSTENCSGRGKRFGADQNGAPVLVTASSGNVNVNCFTRLE
uniref:Uncharacterized protein n=1 Tax=Opuntia streptacantha TaxID=393608 RepID=A0A7C9D2K7_OPUST